MAHKYCRNKPPLVLSLDGGGPGTLSQLYILEELLTRLAHDLNLDPKTIRLADYVDLIAGTGWGGFLAIVLGYLRLTIHDALNEVLEVARAVFPPGATDRIYPDERTCLLRESVICMLRRHGVSPDASLYEKRHVDPNCKVVVFAVAQAHLDHPRLFRSYASRQSSPNCSILDAICATMAMPSLFGPTQIGNQGVKEAFVGASMGFNNPTREMMKEARHLYGRSMKDAIVLSLGCGRSSVLALDSTREDGSYSRLLERISNDCERVAKELLHERPAVAKYLRLNVDQGLEHLVSSNWSNLGVIKSHTSAYLESVSGEIDEMLHFSQGMLAERELVDSAVLKWMESHAFQLKIAALFFFKLNSNHLALMVSV